MLRRRLSVLFGLVFRMNLSVSRCVYIGPSALALGLAWTRRFAVRMPFRLQYCSQNPANRPSLLPVTSAAGASKNIRRPSV
jgi:hypothetical protein